MFVWFGLSVFGLCSCSKDDSAASGPTGTFSMSVQASGEVIVGQSVSRVGEDAENGSGNPLPEVDDFSVSVSNHGESVLEWSAFREMKEEGNCELRPGTYTAEAWYGDVEKEGFGQDYFAGSQEFAVKRGENTPVSVTCYRGNALLSVVYTDEFKSYFSASYSAEVFSSLGNTVEYVQDESRFASFAPGELSVSVRVKKPGQAEEAEYPVMAFPAEARHAYTLTLDVDVSSATMTVSFSEEVSEESVEFDVSDEALNTPAPRLAPSGFQNGVALAPVEGVAWEDNVSVVANAEAGLASFRMRVASSYVEGKGVTGEVDLMSSDPNVETLRTLGLEMKGLTGNVDRMALIDYTALVGNLPAGNDENSFTVYAVDNYGKKSDELTLKVTPQFCGFAVAAAEGEVPFLGNTCRVNISFIDGAPSKASFSLADGGQPLTVTQVSEVTEAEGRKQYTIDLQAPDGVQFKEPFKVSASYLDYNKTTDDLDVEYGILVDSEADVWAKRAVVHVYNEEDLSSLTFQQYGENGDWQNVSVKQTDGNYVTVSGLPSGSAVKLRAIKSGAEPTNEVDVETEEELQVGNPGFEDWHESFVWKGSLGLGSTDINTFYPYKENESDQWWSTRNDLTTTKDGGYSYYYVAYPGTTPVTSSWAASGKVGLPTTYCDGANSAEIATVGWGKESTCTTESWFPPLSNSMNCKNHTAGALFIGTYANGQENYGHEFASRPDKMTFLYRFHSYNNESASALIRIEHRDGNQTVVLAEKTLLLTSDKATTDVESGTIELEYASSDYKATHITISFLSSTAENPSIEPYYVPENFNGNRYSRGIGNVLVVDNVSLIYE